MLHEEITSGRAESCDWCKGDKIAEIYLRLSRIVLNNLDHVKRGHGDVGGLTYVPGVADTLMALSCLAPHYRKPHSHPFIQRSSSRSLP